MKKVVSAVVILLFVGIGTIYASSHAAQNLSAWYGDVFQKKSEILGSETASHFIVGIVDFSLFVKQSMESLDMNIEDMGDNQLEKTNSTINAHRSELIDSVNEAVELQDVSFDHYVSNRNIEAEILLEVEAMLEELLNE